MARVRANGRWSVPGASGVVADGWKVNTYIAGTSTRKDTYTTNDESVANANPVILNARGEATIYWSGTYKVVVTDENDTVIWTEDDYGAGEDQTVTGNFNLVKNGSFETDTISNGEPDDWTIVDYTDGVHAIDATDQYHGLNSLKFTSVGTGGGYATSEYFEVREGKEIFADWAMKSSVATVRNVVDIIWYTSAKTSISTTNMYDDSTTNPTSWTAKSGSGTPPSTARYAQLRAYGCHSSDATSGSTWFDDVEMYSLRDATTTRKGIAEIATQAEVDAGADTSKYVTPETLAGNSIISSGAWTPVLWDDSLSDGEGQTYTTQNGIYTKIGDQVFIQGNLRPSSLGTLTVGNNANIGGLPFAATERGSISFGKGSTITVTALASPCGYIGSGNSHITIQNFSSTTGSTSFTISNVTSNGDLCFSGHYKA